MLRLSDDFSQEGFAFGFRDHLDSEAKISIS